MSHFVERILDHLENNPDSYCLYEVHGPDLVPFDKDDFLKLVIQAQCKLQSLGVKKGDRVILLGSNSAMWIACDLAIISSGAVTVPLYHRQDPAELAFMAEDCQPTLFIYADLQLRDELLKHWQPTCQDIILDEMFLSNDTTGPQVELNSSDPATIIYTSGTSGHPKGVVLTIGNIDFMLERTTNQLYQAKKNDDNTDLVFHFLPLCFAGSRMMLWTQLYRDNPVYVSMDLKNLVQEMATAEPDFYLNVPAILERIRTGVEAKVMEKGGLIAKLYKTAMRIGFSNNPSSLEKIKFYFLKAIILASIRKKIGTNLQFLICGSAALHPETQKWFNIIGITVLQVYGLTETTAIVTMDEPGNIALGYVGKPIDGVEIKLSDEGELLCRGPNIFPGYWNRPEETQKCFEEGWFKTGDLVEISSTGHVKISGRVKNVIIPTSGHNIVPEPIEELFQKACPKSEHAVLIGHGKPHLGIIVTGPASDKDIAHAIDEVNKNVPHYRKIKDFIHYKDGFTVENGLLTVNQKIKRNAVEKLLMPQIEKMYHAQERL